jgi:FAD/FMN-containing dehydrogenase
MIRTIDTELAEFAAEVGVHDPVVALGNGTRFDLGGPPAADARVVSAPVGVVDYAPEEMTVLVRAGTTVAALHAELALSEQRTSLPERGGTVGGAVMVGENCPFALGRGPVRNAILQVRYVSADGIVVTGGGPTVKNVSGFDLPRLMTGSMGTLGLLGDVIVRTNPIPAISRWLAADDADPFEVFDALFRPGAIFHDGAVTTVLLEGHGVDVDLEQKVLDGLGGFSEVSGPPPLPAHRWSMTPAALRRIDGRETGEYVALIGVGMVHATNPPPPRCPDAASVIVAQRLKSNFDPTGRLNPGRSVAATTLVPSNHGGR